MEFESGKSQNKMATTLMKELGKQWSAMSETDKTIYTQMAEQGMLSHIYIL